MKIACLDIGGTKIKSAFFSDDKMLKYRETDTDASLGGGHVVEKAIAILSDMEKADAIGISTAGQVNPVTGTIIYANENIPNYTGMNIKDILERQFETPVFVENDVNSAALGEYHYGNKGLGSHMLCVTYGTGIGGAMVLNGSIYSGSSYSACEFGHIITHFNGEICGCGKNGCYEAYASTSALLKKAEKLFAIETSITGYDFFDLVDTEHQTAKTLFKEWAEEVAVGLASLIHSFNPSSIILGGGIMERDDVVDFIKQRVYNLIMDSYRSVDIKNAVLGNKAGLYGARYIAEKSTIGSV